MAVSMASAALGQIAHLERALTNEAARLDKLRISANEAKAQLSAAQRETAKSSHELAASEAEMQRAGSELEAKKTNLAQRTALCQALASEHQKLLTSEASLAAGERHEMLRFLAQMKLNSAAIKAANCLEGGDNDAPFKLAEALALWEEAEAEAGLPECSAQLEQKRRMLASAMLGEGRRR